MAAAWEWIISAVWAVILSVDAVWARDVITAALFLWITVRVGRLYVAKLQHRWAIERKRAEVQSALQIETYLSIRRISARVSDHEGTFKGIVDQCAVLEGDPNGAELIILNDLMEEIGETLQEMVEANALRTIAFAENKEANRLYDDAFKALSRIMKTPREQRDAKVNTAAAQLAELSACLLKATDYGPVKSATTKSGG